MSVAMAIAIAKADLVTAYIELPALPALLESRVATRMCGRVNIIRVCPQSTVHRRAVRQEIDYVTQALVLFSGLNWKVYITPYTSVPVLYLRQATQSPCTLCSGRVLIRPNRASREILVTWLANHS